jgi:Histidine kinase-, DNA gyrase B-, and HSP90-like ATPase
VTGFAIVTPELTVNALRDSGYKSTAHALAELIDNAIEAGAELVEVFAVEEAGLVSERVRHRIDRIAVLDNGDGMDPITLRRALKFGDGTRQARHGMGRFGMGLPNSSLSQCARVDVWSWQSGPANALHTALDLADIRGGLADVPEPVHDPLSNEWQELSEGLTDSGTLVVWSELDRVQWRGAAKTLENTALLIGRMYRRFLADGRVRLRLVPVRDGKASDGELDARPNDPTYLIERSSTPPPFDGQPMFRSYGAGVGAVGIQRFTIRGVDGNPQQVLVRSSIAKDVARLPDIEGSPWPEQYKTYSPGSTPWGKHAGRNVGVSLMRGDRELDLDDKWTSSYDPAERWWGIEIEFPPQLDEVFGVTNNKQSANAFSALSQWDWKLEASAGETITEFKMRLRDEGDPRYPLIDLVLHIRDKLLSRLRQDLRLQTQGASKSRARHEPATDQADAAVNRRNAEGHESQTQELAEQESPERAQQQQVENLTEVHRLSPEDAKRQVNETSEQHHKVRMIASLQDSPAFFNVEFFPDVLQVALNMNHATYEQLVDVLDTAADGLSREELADRLQSAASAFKVLLFSWARFEDEQPAGRARERVQGVRWDWGRLASDFLRGAEDE